MAEEQAETLSIVMLRTIAAITSSAQCREPKEDVAKLPASSSCRQSSHFHASSDLLHLMMFFLRQADKRTLYKDRLSRESFSLSARLPELEAGKYERGEWSG